MSGFTALNVEPEDNIEDEIDDTKEIQIEEAFKLYQNALKLHSQGPGYYETADAAYQELFQSEVFKYPEVVTDYGHDQADEATAAVGTLTDQDALPVVLGSADSAANSLPQLVYLAFKSRAQFTLDKARHELQDAPNDRQLLCQYYYSFCVKSFADSASALERDDTDIDLWKKAARIAEILNSQRLVRFCLESVVAGDDDAGESAIDLSGLDEAFASGELRKVLDLIQDDIHVENKNAPHPRNALMHFLQQSNDPYPFLPAKAKTIRSGPGQSSIMFKIGSIIITPTEKTLEAIGISIFEALQSLNSASDEFGSYGNVLIDLSAFDKHNPDIKEVRNTESIANNQSASDLPKDEQTVLREGSPAESVKSPASFHSAQDAIPQIVEIELSPNDNVDEVKTSEPEGQLEDDQTKELQTSEPVDEIRLPTRKRSSTAAGLEEHESRTKSKRLRARESLALENQALEVETANDLHEYNQELLRIIDDSDEKSFDYLNKILDRFVAVNIGSSAALRECFWRQEDALDTPMDVTTQTKEELLLTDMRQAWSDWNDAKGTAITSGHSTRDVIEKASGLTLFLRHLNANTSSESVFATDTQQIATFEQFTKTLSKPSMNLIDLIFMWLISLLTDKSVSSGESSPYLNASWSADMKRAVEKILLGADEQIYGRLVHYAESQASKFYGSENNDILQQKITTYQATELVQSIFELHLDFYVSITVPESLANDVERLRQRDRLARWAQLANDYMQTLFSPTFEGHTIDPVVLRHVWASAQVAGQTADEDKSHVLACLENLRVLLRRARQPIVVLPNNAAMPQISIAAIDQEVSRLSTLDFFMSVFDSDSSDPLATIMKLEPILDVNRSGEADERVDTSSNKQIAELRAFLNSGDASLKLFLWRRLQNAYASISYNPRVVICLLNSLGIIVQELQTERHRQQDQKDRQLAMFRWLRDADELINKIVSCVSNDSTAFESVDEYQLQSSTATVIFMLRLLHGFVLYDDAVRVGQMAAPTLRASSAKLYEKSRDRLRETYVRLWTLLFYLLKEATIQLPASFDRVADELAEYLRNVHNALGHRQYCKHCNKLFVKLVKSELLAMDSDIDYSQDIAQILYDLYQLKFNPGVGDADHGCTPELLRDKTTAMTLVPLIMSYAKRLNPRDLIKSELKTTIDKIQHCLGPIKAPSTLSYNKKAISAFLRSAINPQIVYRALKGIGDIMTKPVQGDYANIAASGWYLLLGQMSLAKFRSIKRVSPTSTDDLDLAGTYLRHDLEHNLSNWQTWYRLAQVFDAKIEDCLIWNSTKLNDARGDIATLERNAINAYTMATTMAMREADESRDTLQQLSDMYADFAMRLYASSRPPLHMEAFSTDKHMRHLSSNLDQSMSKAPFVQPFQPYMVWKLAARLLRMRFTSHAKEWLCQYTLGKCFWKIFQSPENARSKEPVQIDLVLDAFTEAVELAPKKEKASDPILEPHYKIVSVIHKLVHRKLLDPHKAMEYLRITPFAKGARVSEDEHGHMEWEPYILDVLKKLGQADKSNWHHRITARAAHVIYDDDPNLAGALGAKHQLTLQIFTKTMSMQVWKPENERAGRHYVYTGRYLAFFVHLLEQLSDRVNMEQLVRRIRRKTTDFIDHTRVWEDTALTYVRMLRRIAKVGEGKERALFDKISYEEFVKMSEKLEQWAHTATTESIYLDIIHDAIELKKLNNSLMKGPAIDDLVGDTYATMYELYVSQLPPEEVNPLKTSLPQGTFINMTTESAPTGDDKVDRMRLNNILSAQIDGQPSALSVPPVVALQTTPRGTPPVEAARLPTPNKPGRTKTITRREVQRKAEAAANRPAAPKTPIQAKKLLIDVPSLSRNDSLASNASEREDAQPDYPINEQQEDSKINSRRSSISNSRPASDAGEEEDDNEEEEEEEEQADDVNEADADEADDESEASEVDIGLGNSKISSRFSSSNGRKRKAEEDAEEDNIGDDEGQDGDDEDNNDGDDEEGEEDGEEEDMESDKEGVESELKEEDPDPDTDTDTDEPNQSMEIQDSQEQQSDS